VVGEPAPGDIVDIKNQSGFLLGRGYYNPASQITVRRLTELDEQIDRDFFVKRITQAFELRRRLLPQAESFRLVYGEGDQLPGLVVDKFEDTLVLHPE
jgi:23S rRNA (cytosine1962-C5)-methyltransferase